MLYLRDLERKRIGLPHSRSTSFDRRRPVRFDTREHLPSLTAQIGIEWRSIALASHAARLQNGNRLDYECCPPRALIATGVASLSSTGYPVAPDRSYARPRKHQ